MKIMSLGANQPVIIVSFTGEVMYMNKEAKNELHQIRVGQSFSDIVDIEKLRRLTVFEKCVHLIDVSVGSYKEATVKICTLGNERCIELRFFKNESNRTSSRDSELFETYREYSQIKREGQQNAKEFADYITAEVGKDIRFAHKKISCHVSGVTLFSYKEQLKIVTVAIMTVLNEICYKSDFLLEMKEADGLVYMKISANTLTNVTALSQYDIARAFPQVEIRLSYIYELCHDNGIELSFKILNGEASVLLTVERAKNKGRELRFALSDGISVEKIINTFSYLSAYELLRSASR